MKKILTLLLACLMLLALAACSQPDPTEPPVQNPTDGPTEVTPTDPPQSRFELAYGCIDKDIQDLYDLIGKPDRYDYAPSCLGEGDDGNLYYDGFIVYTYREGDTETIQFVEEYTEE